MSTESATAPGRGGDGQRILLSQATVTELEEEYVLDALRSGWVAPLGPHVDAFEAEIAARCGVDHALALSSGTAALHLALDGMGAGPETVVVLSSMTFAATANAVAYTGATPVFVDACADGNLDPALLDEALGTLIAEGADIAAVIPVDLFGRVCDYDAIDEVMAAHAGEQRIPVLSDAAEALGASFRGRPAGSFGQAAALSFNGNKIMTTSGGGMLLSDDGGLVDRARYLSTQARQPVPWYEHTDIGYNYRLSNILAALGRAQLQRLDDLVARRRAIRDLYAVGLRDLPGIRFLGREDGRGDDEDNAWLTCIVIDPRKYATSADEVVAAMNAVGIEVRHLWKPMHRQPVFAHARWFGPGHSDALFAQGVTLPSGAGLSDGDVERVVTVLRDHLLDASSGR
ncbi:MAG: DegT/DnrJ/EryC1/StrS family aminotransferase [Dermatophilaceae bacterium]|nr:aminotransferase class I/II-fold pyridoxal phosphate-dependent enzyme [Intrasporangiaceae bacterium]